jgi:cyclin B
MYEENFENLPAKSRRSLSGTRRFGTDLTKLATNKRYTVSKSLKKVHLSTSEDFFTEIYKILHNTEVNHLPSPDYMQAQIDINANMRGILIDWLVTIQSKMRFNPETLFLTVNIIDRYLEKAQVSRKELQLVGICSMFIACKYEESVVPEIKDLIYITADAYSKEQVIDMEFNMVMVLNFNFTIVTSLKFLERYANILSFGSQEYYLARYFLELTLVEYAFLKYKPSAIAASAVFLVDRYRRKCGSFTYPADIPYYYSEIRDCMMDLVYLISKAQSMSLQGIKNKYMTESCMEVSKLAPNCCFLAEVESL